MIIKLIIHNYKLFKDFAVEFNDDLNIIVGDNEAGKSTILEAVNLALTKKLNGRFIENELSPYLFNIEITSEFVEKIQRGENPDLPEIFVELYLSDVQELASFKGTNNSLRENCVGIKLLIEFDDDFKEEYEKLMENRNQVNLIPIEFYRVHWRAFSDNKALTTRSIPINHSFIDTTSIRLQSGTDYYMQNIINEGLEPKERVTLAVEYRKLKESFSGQTSIEAINQKLDDNKGSITDKQLAIAIDISQKSNWETNLTPHLDDLPFQFSGKGEQSSLKMMLALERRVNDTSIVLIEEPENHQSFSSMNKLLKKIKEKCEDKQIIICTHDSYVLNKLGLEKLILIANNQQTRLSDLPEETQKYFKKLPGYDTLRVILAKRAILVEGPSDELIVQKAYQMEYDKLPIENGVDVISVRGLSFKRFLDIAKELNIQVSVVTDNDGDYVTKVENKYVDYIGLQNINICYDTDNDYPTLEPQLVKCNGVETLNSILGTSFTDESSLIEYMTNSTNKTECALKLFESDQVFEIPQYIKDAITQE